MDYLEIIRKGYFDKTERENLPDYLLEQYHKAESKTMTLKRFFDGCFNAIEALNKDIETRLLKRKEQLTYGAENSEKNKDYFIDELKEINRNNFGATLPQGGQLWAKDIDVIKEAIQIAKNINGLFEQLNQAGNIYLDELKDMFFKKYGKPNQRTVTDELNEINNFIAKAESFSTKEICEKTILNTFDKHRDKYKGIERLDFELMFEYSRLNNGYYKSQNYQPYFTSFFNVQTTWVYSKYFLYKKWLEDLNKQFAPPPTVEPQQESKTEPEQQQNPYPRIFTSFQAFQLCQHLMKNNIKNQLADVSCFFHFMVKDEFIFNNIKRKEFLEYLQIEHDIPIEKLRPDGYNITDPKKQIYTTVKSQFQLH